ncbi:c-type cytochrome [Alcaligenes ammonioxydans]|jgi:cytochrome c|uniref:c-type cytochrome n=1 Tax=Alcaligenes TaxID=507 RepID=UPI000269ED92|nr:c-type cytochrome [Alcaligenes ammonioxydans]EJC65686.1 cytochrome C551 [Alcaligenes faecalis subsp. faecalis NCIB 8687]MCH1878533.1 c-type cytochrome [Alcaligenes ammonioxydans]WGQ34025.1 c-type cytochrome [Alcaligenes faecalis]HRK84685.1 c-type cytochrome [Alcaligenes faecalis]
MAFKQWLVCTALLSTAFNASAADAGLEAVKDILTRNACLSCHTVERKVVGPAYRDIAAKRKDDPANAEILVQHIRQGSKGVYGPLPMPANPVISDKDIQAVVDWIMAGAPQ